MANDAFQIFVQLLDGKNLALQFPIQQRSITAGSMKQQIQTLTQIPSQFQRITLDGKFISDDALLPRTLSVPTLQLTFSLLGGKGGFGSLLRGAPTKAGQKKTSNFDACRDMSGRRLRHVNAEKKMEEWKEEEEDRKLEKLADDYLKKMDRTSNKKQGSGADMYVQKYKEDSAKCVEEVERSVRESAAELLVGRKRKLLERLREKDGKDGVDAKKLKIWMGKQAIGESDSDDSGEDDYIDNTDAENKKSVIDNENHSDSSKEHVVESHSCFSDAASEEQKETVTGGSSRSSCSPSGGGDCSLDDNGVVEPALNSEILKIDRAEKVSNSQQDISLPDGTEAGNTSCHVTDQTASGLTSPQILGSHSTEAVSDVNKASGFIAVVDAEKSIKSSIISEASHQPLNFDVYNSAAELETLGLERLKLELQSRGLKCGGTLQERSARLFLLKTTPVENLPKKLLAKK